MKVKLYGVSVDQINQDMSLEKCILEMTAVGESLADDLSTIHRREEELEFIESVGEGILKDFGKTVGGLAKKGTKSIAKGSKMGWNLIKNILANTKSILGKMFSALIGYEKKYKDLPKNIEKALKKLHSTVDYEGKSISIYNIEAEKLSRLVPALEIDRFLGMKIGGIELEEMLDIDAAEKDFESYSKRMDQIMKATGEKEISSNILKVVAKSLGSDLQNKKLSDKSEIIEALTGKEVELEDENIPKGLVVYLQAAQKITGDDVVKKTLGSCAKQIDKLITRVEKAAKSNTKSNVNMLNDAKATAEDEVKNEAGESIKFDANMAAGEGIFNFNKNKGKDDDDIPDAEMVDEKPGNNKSKNNVDKNQDVRGAENARILQKVYAGITKAFTDFVSAILTVYRTVIMETTTIIEFIHSL